MAWLAALLKSLPFANAAMLLWGLAASVPIIIHLWSRRKYHEMTWAAMEFLLAAVRKNARRIRIEQLILLLIRVAILVFLAIALADPIFSLFPTLGTSLGTGGRTHFVLVLDASYSMDYRAGQRTRFEQAKEFAAQVVEDSRQGDGFTLVLLADPPQTLISDPAFDPKDVLEELERLRLRHGGANLTMTLSEIEGVVQRGEEQPGRLTETTVCFFTDLGATTWEEVAAETCRQRISKLAEKATLVLFDVGQVETQNAAVTTLAVRDALITVGRNVTVEAEVQNFASRDPVGQRIAFRVDGQEVHAERLDVPAGGRATVSFSHVFDTPGEHEIEAELGEDPLSVDNVRWASVPVRESIEVLCVEGKPGAARYVAYALEPAESLRPRVRPVIRYENAILEQDLNRYDCVFLCNVGRFSREEAAVLSDFVAGGGGLVITLGDQVQADSYNEQLGGESTGRRILPARLGTIVSEAQYFFDPREYRHPIVAPFADHEKSGLLSTPVWKYFQLEVYDPLTARVALAFQTGDPAIVEQRIGRGRTILVATAVSPESVDRSTDPPTPWTAIAAWPSFPPLVQEMLALVVRRGSESRNLRVGEPLEGVVAGSVAGVSLDVESPDGESERVPLKVEGESSQWVYGGTLRSGVYRATFGAPLDRVELYAVNVDSRESNLERLDPELLPSQFGRDFHVDASSSVLPVTRPIQYFRYFLGLVLLLLLLETLFAWYLGTASA
jgi:hypothetical protein